MEYNRNDIAVCGYSCRFPMAKDSREFWENILEGKDCITRIDSADPGYVGAYGRMENTKAFDYKFFGIPEKEAVRMDPQQRWLITLCYEALENSGHKVSDNNYIGIFAGASDFFSVWKRIFQEGAGTEEERFLHQRYLDGMLTSWVSYVLDLTGPSVPVKEACATSLAAVHLAVNSLLNGECDVALAGGINISCEQKQYVKAENTMSQKGIVRSFDTKADGFVPGNGGGIIVLKRLEDSIRDGDTIHAVIKGSALANDGKKPSGYSMPTVDGESIVMEDALSVADVDPKEVTYIEAHGTATAIGDIIEIEAIRNVYQTENRQRNNPLHVGSIKNNMGHLNFSAGIAGILKAIMMVDKGVIVPMANFESANEELNLQQSNMAIDKNPKQWTTTGKRRLAGISSFGVGGQNCHIIIENYLGRDYENGVEKPVLIPISAMTKNSLEQYEKNLADFACEEEFSLEDMAYTFQLGRENYEYRSFISAQNKQQLVEKLKQIPVSKRYSGNGKDVNILLFQGSSQVPWPVVKSLIAYNRVFEESFGECFEILKKISNVDLRQYADKENVPIELEFMLVFCLEYAQRKWLEHLGVKGDIVLGYSAGEYMAAEAAESISLRDALSICWERNQLFKNLDEYAMLVVATSKEKLENMNIDGVNIVTVNTDDRVTIALPPEQVGEVKKILKQERIKFFKMPLSRAGHCSLVKPVLDDMREIIDGVEFETPNCRFVSSYLGRECKNEMKETDYWINQTANPVLFRDAVKAISNEKNAVVIDLGLNGQLSSMYRRNLDFESDQVVVSAMPDHCDNPVLNSLDGLGLLWQSGVGIKWKHLYERKRTKIPAPTYAFEYHTFGEKNISKEHLTGQEQSDDVRDLSIQERTLKIFNDLFELELTKADLKRSIYDFKFDSMSALMACSMIQKTYDIEFTMRNFMISSTLGEVISRVEEIVDDKSSKEKKNEL